MQPHSQPIGQNAEETKEPRIRGNFQAEEQSQDSDQNAEAAERIANEKADSRVELELTTDQLLSSGINLPNGLLELAKQVEQKMQQ